MKKYIALLRGINVGGNHILPMKELRTMLEMLGFQEVRTYIQSGNVVFSHDGQVGVSEMADRISRQISKEYGFEPRVLLLELEEMQQAVDSNPFPEAEEEPKNLHLNFLAAVSSNPNLDEMEKLKKPSEQFILKDKVFYLYAPEGIGRSKLAAKVEKLLGVSVTGRNWRSVRKIMELAKE
ncbi:MAG: DUF1697 domain-containing protein [Balneolaceae bacterium]